MHVYPLTMHIFMGELDNIRDQEFMDLLSTQGLGKTMYDGKIVVNPVAQVYVNKRDLKDIRNWASNSTEEE